MVRVPASADSVPCSPSPLWDVERRARAVRSPTARLGARKVEEAAVDMIVGQDTAHFENARGIEKDVDASSEIRERIWQPPGRIGAGDLVHHASSRREHPGHAIARKA